MAEHNDGTAENRDITLGRMLANQENILRELVEIKAQDKANSAAIAENRTAILANSAARAEIRERLGAAIAENRAAILANSAAIAETRESLSAAIAENSAAILANSVAIAETRESLSAAIAENSAAIQANSVAIAETRESLSAAIAKTREDFLRRMTDQIWKFVGSVAVIVTISVAIIGILIDILG